MPVTKEQAAASKQFHYAPRCELRAKHEGREKDRPTIERWRANGALQTWKRTPGRFRLPIKYGLRGYHEITDANADQFHTEADCPHKFS